MAACTQDLLNGASCLDCLNQQQLLAVIACQLATANGMACDPTTLLGAASCLLCLNPQQLLAVIACQVANSSGSFTLVQTGTGVPTGGTATTPPIYEDITDPNAPKFYIYANGTWTAL